MSKRTLNGVYLVIDPAMERSVMLKNVHEALEGGVDVLQVWNHWPNSITTAGKEQLLQLVCELAAGYEVPVLVNNDWQLLKTTDLDGVHFDTLPDNFDHIKKEINRDFIAGLTCTNNLKAVRRAQKMQFDYISFCAMYPSPSAGSCEIVSPETVRNARKITDMSLFLSGGITPAKIAELAGLDFNGVAVISGILKSDAPRNRTQEYKRALE